MMQKTVVFLRNPEQSEGTLSPPTNKVQPHIPERTYMSSKIGEFLFGALQVPGLIGFPPPSTSSGSG